MIDFRSNPRCFRKDEHGETLLSRMRYLFKEVRRHLFTLNPLERPALDQPDTASIQLATHGAFYSCKRPYDGGYATAYASVLAVLIYTQMATSARESVQHEAEKRKFS